MHYHHHHHHRPSSSTVMFITLWAFLPKTTAHVNYTILQRCNTTWLFVFHKRSRKWEMISFQNQKRITQNGNAQFLKQVGYNISTVTL